MSSRQFTITYEDGTVEEGEGREFDDVKVERHFGKPLTKILQEAKGDGEDDAALPVELMWFYTYCAARRVNPEHPDFDTWAEKVTDIEVTVPEEESDDPLDRTP